MDFLDFSDFLDRVLIGFYGKSSCYVQNYEVISIVTGEQNVLLTVGKGGSIIEKLKEMLEEYLKNTESEYYPPVENLLDLIYEHYTENNSAAPETTVVGRAVKEKERELEKWLKDLDGMEQLVEDYGGQIPLWEKIMDRQWSVWCVWEKTAF